MSDANIPKADSIIPAEIMSDLEAVCRAAAAGQQLDDEFLNRVRERADRVRDEVFQKHGLLDIGVPAIRELRDSE